jgi:hypothetical protein
VLCRPHLQPVIAGRLKGRKDGGRLLFTREDLDGICRGVAMSGKASQARYKVEILRADKAPALFEKVVAIRDPALVPREPLGKAWK